MRGASGDEHHNLPVQRTRLIGRELDSAAVRQAVLESEGHLVTLTGAGGCGKTRLALQVATDLVHDHSDGVWLVELAPVADPRVVPEAVAAALGIQQQSSRSILNTLVAWLKHRWLLLVLDNCEHLVTACAELADALLTSCPDLRLLATSREPLRVEGEVTWRVESLAIPDLSRSQHLDAHRSPAVQLLQSAHEPSIEASK